MEPSSVRTHPVSEVCPVCGETMVVTRLSCATCGSSLEGAFSLAGAQGESGASRRSTGPLSAQSERAADRIEERFGRLTRLDDAQLQFVEAFLRCRGVIKNVEDMLGISYPTVRARLANVLETMGFGPDGELPPAESRRARREILADLAAGRISTEEAHRLLARDTAEPGDDEST
ncbi:MAG TPA: DUF2089 domain-containing protein [Ktedonobacterales bacterium]